MTPGQRTELESLLESVRQRLAATEAGLVAEHDAVVEASVDANLDDEHDPEGATVGFERARVASLLAQVRRHGTEVEEALERLRAGVYGTCERCRRPIDFERLAAQPTAVRCVPCAAAQSTALQPPGRKRLNRE